MKCPTCPDSTLVMTDRSGIEIDYCPTCRGVWLDRGELDKIIERSAAALPEPAATARRAADFPSPAPAPMPSGEAPRRYRDDDDDDDDDWRRRSHDGYKPKKRKSLLGELFDF